MVVRVLQFNALSELAAYSKQMSGRGYKINVQRLTIECKLDDKELEMACEQFGATLLTKTKTEI